MKSATRMTTRDRSGDLDRMLDETLEETFPASDPVACTPRPSIGPLAGDVTTCPGRQRKTGVSRSTRPARDTAALSEPITGARS